MSATAGLRPGVTSIVNGLPDATTVTFDDERVVANAGILLPVVLADRLGIEALIDETVLLGDRAGAAHFGRKVMTPVSAMALGADSSMTATCCARVRARGVGHGVSAPSS